MKSRKRDLLLFRPALRLRIAMKPEGPTVRISRSCRASQRDARGAAAVEFALVLIPLLTLIFGMIQYGLYFWSLESGSHAAREAARQAAVGALDCTQLRAAVLDNARGAKASSVVASRAYYTNATLATPAPSPSPGNAVKVTVKFDSIDMGLPFVPFIEDGRVHEVAVARVESTTANSSVCP